jgi:hypothetical protein
MERDNMDVIRFITDHAQLLEATCFISLAVGHALHFIVSLLEMTGLGNWPCRRVRAFAFVLMALSSFALSFGYAVKGAIILNSPHIHGLEAPIETC